MMRKATDGVSILYFITSDAVSSFHGWYSIWDAALVPGVSCGQ